MTIKYLSIYAQHSFSTAAQSYDLTSDCLSVNKWLRSLVPMVQAHTASGSLTRLVLICGQCIEKLCGT